MKAKDVMTTPVVAVPVGETVETAVSLMLKHHISGLPVIDTGGRLVGLVSEGDLIRRLADGDKKRHSWWLALLGELSESSADFVKAKSHHVADVMTREVVFVDEDTSVAKIANLLEAKRIKRVPVVRNGSVVGIVSRANLLHALSVLQAEHIAGPSGDDRILRAKVQEALAAIPNVTLNLVNFTVDQGNVTVTGAVHDASEEHAIQVAIENVDGVVSTKISLGTLPSWAFGFPV